MTLLNIADMLSDILELQDVYAGTIDGNLDKCIGVYNDLKATAYLHRRKSLHKNT